MVLTLAVRATQVRGAVALALLQVASLPLLAGLRAARHCKSDIFRF